MIPNREKFKKDLETLLNKGDLLVLALKYRCFPGDIKKQIEKEYKEKTDAVIKNIPEFNSEYQSWYSESLMLMKLLLPDRVDDFVRNYEKPKQRKAISFENYVIEDCLQNLVITRGFAEEKVVGPEGAIPRFNQQLNILKSVKRVFESSLFDIKRIVQANLFDTELEAASELNNKGFGRGAGAMAGVVLEAHLARVCEEHKIELKKKNLTINDYNQVLKDKGLIEVPDWRFIQHLADIRNLCDHDKKKDPTKEDINDLISGVAKIIKKVF